MEIQQKGWWLSKIIEALKVRSSAKPEETTPELPPKEVQIEKTGHELTQEQLAEIYFSATGKQRTSEPPVIIKIVERPRVGTWVPWLIASIAFLITSLSLFSTKRVFIEVKVLDEKSPFVRSLDAQRAEEQTRATQEAAAPELSAENVSTHKVPMEDFLFEGAAYLNSSRDKNGGLTLINSSVAPFARATLHLDPPQDLTDSRITFYAKGGRGGENVAFAIKDRQNTQGFYKGKIYPFPDRLTTAWQKAEIQVGMDTTKDFDGANVTNMRFEFGSKDTGNKPSDVVYIKDLQWAKAGSD